MSRQQWRSSIIMFVFAFTIVLLVLSLTVRKSAPYQASQNLPSLAAATPPPPNPANYVPSSSGQAFIPPSLMPTADAANLADHATVPRYPNSVLLDRRDTMMTSQLYYASLDRPTQIAGFYANYAATKLGMYADSFRELGSGTYGFQTTYSSSDRTASIIIFATSQNMDGPSGGNTNPTYINLMIIGQIKPLDQPTATIPPAWLTPQTWGLPPYTPPTPTRP